MSQKEGNVGELQETGMTRIIDKPPPFYCKVYYITIFGSAKQYHNGQKEKTDGMSGETILSEKKSV